MNRTVGSLNRILTIRRIGRAGRPQFDSFGVAVVMTTKNMVGVYSKILHGQKAIDSRLFAGNPVEHINAEISMSTCPG